MSRVARRCQSVDRTLGFVELVFSGDLWFWRGPAPWHFVTVPDEEASAIEAVGGLASYGWGMIPVTVTVGATTFTTSLWPKDDTYIVPLKTAVRKAERLELGDQVDVRLVIDV
jgi:hypothetical protein